MASLAIFHPLLRRAWDAIYNKSDPRKPAATNRLEKRLSFDYAFGILFLFVLHGVSGFKILVILYTNYKISKNVPRAYLPAATWIFNICTLFANELSQGYQLHRLASYLSPPSTTGQASELMQWGSTIDSYGGIVARWEVLFNITVLRLISFNMDYYWSIDRNKVNLLEVS